MIEITLTELHWYGIECFVYVQSFRGSLMRRGRWAYFVLYSEGPRNVEMQTLKDL